ncbi:MAG: acyltransferase [Bacteroidales bacterium]
MNIEILKKEIFKIESTEKFNELCMEVFYYQAKNNKVYSEYLDLLNSLSGKGKYDINSPQLIPALPIQFFKSKKIVSSNAAPQIIFTSSATTGMVPSKHYVIEKNLYEQSFVNGFRFFYGDPQEYTILALLPSYLEREGSSLVYMAKTLIEMSKKAYSGFYLYNHAELFDVLSLLKKRGEKTILLGVSFALLNFIANYNINFPNLIVIETGGMKGRGKELTRDVLHANLAKGFGVKNIHSEYGMAELLSQAYLKEDGIFNTPPWMKIMIRNLYNPFEYYIGEDISPIGGINIIDLANINSCSFIETQDMGKVFANGSFTIEGRIKDSELRGCNMLLEPQ